MNKGKDMEDESNDDTKPPAQPKREDTKPPAQQKRRRQRVRSNYNMDLEDADEEEWNDDDEAEEVLDEEDEEASKGPIIPLPGDLCIFAEDKCRHFAHEQCVETMRDDGLSCPVCKLLHSRVHLVQTRIAVDESGEMQQTDEVGASYHTYCKNVTVTEAMPSGFKASAKVRSLCKF